MARFHRQTRGVEHIYLITRDKRAQFPDGSRGVAYKIGVSLYPEDRADFLKARLVCSVPVVDAYTVERAMHNEFDGWRIPGRGSGGSEWFVLDEHSIKVIRMYMVRVKYYPATAFDIYASIYDQVSQEHYYETEERNATSNTG